MLRLWLIFLMWFFGSFRFYRLEYFTWRMEIEVFERINVVIFPLNSTYTKNQEQGENQNEFCGAGLEFELPIYVNLSIYRYIQGNVHWEVLKTTPHKQWAYLASRSWFLFKKKKKQLIYFTALGLSSSTQDLPCSAGLNSFSADLLAPQHVRS